MSHPFIDSTITDAFEAAGIKHIEVELIGQRWLIHAETFVGQHAIVTGDTLGEALDLLAKRCRRHWGPDLSMNDLHDLPKSQRPGAA